MKENMFDKIGKNVLTSVYMFGIIQLSETYRFR